MSAHNGTPQPVSALFPLAFLDELRDRCPLVSVVQEAVPLKRDGKRWKGLCPFHAEKSGSFKVYPDNRFKCYGCGAAGDVFTFIEKRHGVKFPEAVERVANAAGVPLPDTYTPRARSRPSAPPQQPAKAQPAEREKWRPMVPPPADAPPPTDKQLHCDVLHTYRDARGDLLFYVRRIEARGKKRKLFVPLTYGVLEKEGVAVTGWHDRAPDAPQPLYGLDKLAARPDAPVMVCEGEKAADAAQWLFPDLVCVTWPGGAAAVAKADWAPLVERQTAKFIWPDNDAPGCKAAAEVAALVPGARVLRVDDLPPGADAADVQPDQPEAWLRDRLPPEPVWETPLPLLWFDRIMPVVDSKDFVQGVLTEGGAAVVYGDSNTGKTFWVIDLALHVATGKAWNGRRVDQGGVVYCAMEGGNGFRNRLAAWRQAHLTPPGATGATPGATPATPFAAIPACLNLLDPEADTPRLIETVQAAAAHMGRPVKLVVVDTLSRAMAGGNENAPDDMGALVRSMDAIRAATGACVLFVHHSGKDAAKGARGHSLLRAAMDTEIEVRADEATGSATATVVKQRELTKGAAFGFRLDVQVLGRNQHGEDVTSCTVAAEAPAPDAGRKGKKLTTDEQGWLRDIQDFFAAPDQPHGDVQPGPDMPLVRGATRNALRDYLRHCMRISVAPVAPGVAPGGPMSATERSTLFRGLNRLKDKGKLGIMGEWVWLL